MIVDEPVRGSFAYLEQPGLFAMPPVEQLRLFVERRLPAPPLTHLSGLVVEEVSKGASTWSIPASPWWQTAAGVFAGGTLAFVADAALAGAVFTTLPTGTQLLSSDLSMNFLQPAGPSSERLVAKGTVIDVGRRQGLSEARVEDAAGRLLAHATSRCVLQPLPFEPPEPPDVPAVGRASVGTRRPTPTCVRSRGRSFRRPSGTRRTGSISRRSGRRGSEPPPRTASCSDFGSLRSPSGA